MMLMHSDFLIVKETIKYGADIKGRYGSLTRYFSLPG